VAGTFANLPLPNDAGALPDGGSVAFTLQVYFFTNAAFSADPNLSTDIASAVAPDGVTAGKACNALGKLQFSYATTCTAIEEDNIVVNAACNPIQCNPAGEFGCAAGGGDSGTEAGSLGTDAGDATTTDARAGADAPSGQDAAHDAGHDAPGGADVAIDGPHD
jgi:hypothetical protein